MKLRGRDSKSIPWPNIIEDYLGRLGRRLDLESELTMIGGKNRGVLEGRQSL